MAYSDFTDFRQIKQILKLNYTVENLFQSLDIPAISSSVWLLDMLADAQKLPVFLSEKARSEMLIWPILREVWKQHEGQIMLFSGVSMDCDKERSLNGICDFLINKGKNPIAVEYPIICLVEAKNRDIWEGLAQCAAEMYAAQILNNQQNKHKNIVYGCVTNGQEWLFLKLDNQTVFIDSQRYFLNQVDKILGLWAYIIKQFF